MEQRGRIPSLDLLATLLTLRFLFIAVPDDLLLG